MTVVEEVRDLSAANAQASVVSIIKARGPRRPRLSLEEKQEIARLYAETSTPTSEICARLGIGESSLYRILQLQGVSLRGRTASSASDGPTPQPAPAQSRTRKRSSNAGRRPGLRVATSGAINAKAIASEVPQTPEPAVAPIAGGARTGRRRARSAEVGRSSELLQFAVTFLAEQTLQATSALDALRQAQARGATEVTSIVRIA